MLKKMILKIKNNSLNDEIEYLKSEIYDLNEKLKNERKRIVIEKEALKIIRALPTAKKRELGLLDLK